MSVRLEAYQTVIYLPDPELGDSEGLAVGLTRKFSMNGTRYTYIKQKSGRRKLIMQFDLTREKGKELHAFIRSYFAKTVLLTDHEGTPWLGNFTVNPFDFETPFVGEYQRIQLEFEGVQQ
jgi:hypothetical protein